MTGRPLRVLTLFSCSGGIDVGLERAGFETIGVDWMPSQRPRAKGKKTPDDGTQFWCGSGECHMADLSTADAVEGVIRAFKPDLVCASPPCQKFSTATPTANRANHPDLIGSTREGILRAGVPGWIENVATDAVPLTGFWIMLCGIMFPETYHVRRHRRFELIDWRVPQPWHDGLACRNGMEGHACGKSVCVPVPHGGRFVMACEGHGMSGERYAQERKRRVAVAVAGNGPPDAGQTARYKRRGIVSINDGETVPPKYQHDRSHPAAVAHIGQNRPGPECIRWREAMGWEDGPRNRYALAQAIPPAYGEWLGTQFRRSRS